MAMKDTGEIVVGKDTTQTGVAAFRANGRVSLNIMGEDAEGELKIGRFGDEKNVNQTALLQRII